MGIKWKINKPVNNILGKQFMGNKLVGWLEPTSVTLIENIDDIEEKDKGTDLAQKGNYKFEAYVTRWDKDKKDWSVKSRNGVRYNRKSTVETFQNAIEENSGLPVMYNHIIEGSEATVLGRIFSIKDKEEGLIVEGYLDGNEPLVKDKISKNLLSNISLQVAADDEKSKKLVENGEQVHYAYPIEAYEVSFVPVNGILGGNLLSTALIESLKTVEPKPLVSKDESNINLSSNNPPEHERINEVDWLDDEEIKILEELVEKQESNETLTGAETRIKDRLVRKANAEQWKEIQRKINEKMKRGSDEDDKGEVDIDNAKGELVDVIIKQELYNQIDENDSILREKLENSLTVEVLNEVYDKVIDYIHNNKEKLKEHYLSETKSTNSVKRLKYLVVKSQFTKLSEGERRELIELEQTMDEDLPEIYSEIIKILDEVGLGDKLRRGESEDDEQENLTVSAGSGAIGGPKLHGNKNVYK